MSKRRLVRGLTSAILTGAMIMSMGGMTAFAAVDSVTFKKTVTTDGSTYAPNTTFNFTVSEAPGGSLSVKEDKENGVEIKNAVVYEGISGGLALSEDNNFTFAPSGTTPSAAYEKTGSIVVNADKFAAPVAPGIYHYQIKETAGTYEGIKYDIAERDLYVFVTQTDGVNSVDSVICAIDGIKSDVEFVNDYGKDDDNDKTHDITITKEVTGNQGDKNKQFDFKVSVAGGEGEWYKVITTFKDKVPEETTLVSGAEAVTYKLKDGESIQIFGLSESDTYTVNEETYEADGYITTNQNNNGKVTADGTTITVTNRKEVATPTGIALSFAPYALLVALAGAFAALFLGKKKRDEF